MLSDLARALPAALAGAVLPGYFWAIFLRPARGLGERLAYSTALSVALVPVVALVLAKAAGSGVTVWIAIAAVAAVFGSGAAAVFVRGAARGDAEPALPRPPLIADPLVLALTAMGLLLAAVTMADHAVPRWALVFPAVALLAAGGLAGVRGWRASLPGTAGESTADPAAAPEPAGVAAGTGAPGARAGSPAATRAVPAPSAPAAGAARPDGPQARALPAWLRGSGLTVVLALTAFRAYIGVVRHDWPFLRGGDLYSHAVMAEQMMTHGGYGSYLIYPPGFSTLTAVVSRLSGLAPLALFPVLAPALLVITTLAAYALATRLWGWEYGLAAAFLSGLVLSGAYNSFAEGRYPDLVGAYFLVPMAVATLIGYFQSPSARSGALLAVTGSAAVFYHSVASLYLALLLAVVGLIAVGYLLRTRRTREARALVLAYAALGGLAVCYALYTYGLPKFLGGSSATAQAVSAALGSQPPLPAVHLLIAVSPAIVWLGVFGLAMLVPGLRRLAGPGQALAVATLLAWCVLMYLGSRTALDGFPQRFERDLGAPLSVTGALGLGVVALSVLGWQRRQRGTAAMACLAAGAVAVVGLQTYASVRASARHGYGALSRPVAAAGAWLARHNTGGNVISTPYMNPGVSSRAVLALGGYTGLQSYQPYRIAHPRSLPTAGKQPLLDSRTVLTSPASCQSAAILARDDIRYVVLYKSGTGADLVAFQSDTARYHRVYANSAVIIYAPVRAATTSCQ